MVAAVTAAIGEAPGRTLLLGVTPELADIASDLVAVDRNHPLVSHVSPGDTTARRAMVGDWLNGNFVPGLVCSLRSETAVSRSSSFRAGRCCCVERIREALRSGGRFAGRFYAAPDDGESGGRRQSGGRWRVDSGISMRSSCVSPWRSPQRRAEVHVGVNEIFAAFQAMFRDRDELVRLHRLGPRTYRHDRLLSKAPSLRTVSRPAASSCRSSRQAFTNIRLVETGTYELAERSPLLVMEKAAE